MAVNEGKSDDGLLSKVTNLFLGSGEEPVIKEYRFILLGKTGSGKSTTGNTILGEKKFHSAPSISSVTSDCKLERTVKHGRKIEILDCPGLCDTSRSEREISISIVQAVACMHPGPHAILFIMRLGRFTREEHKVYNTFKGLFDDHVVRYMIIIITGGDDLERAKATLADLLKTATDDFLKVLEDCGNRCLVFDNSSKKPKLQVDNLLKTVDEIIAANGGKPYTCPKYNKIGEGLEAEVSKRLKELLQRDKEMEERIKELVEKTEAIQKALEEAELTIKRKEDEGNNQLIKERQKFQLEKELLEQRLQESKKAAQKQEVKCLKLELKRKIEEEQKAMSELHRRMTEEHQRLLDEIGGKKKERTKMEEEKRLEEEEQRRRKDRALREEMERMKDNIAKNKETGWIEWATESLGKALSGIRGWLTGEFLASRSPDPSPDTTGQVLRTTSRWGNQSTTRVEKVNKDLQKKESVTKITTKQVKNEDNKLSAEVQMEILSLDVHPISMHVSASSSLATLNPDDPRESLAGSLLKVSSMTEQLVLSSYSATRQTQTDDDPHKRNVDKPVFCEQWQVQATFTSAGGTLIKSRSDVLLTVPPGAIKKGAYRDVYMGVCTDISRIHHLLNLPDIYIASPVAEFWAGAGDGATFDKLVEIYLPHCLTLPKDLDLVQVYRVYTDARGKVSPQLLLRESHSKQTTDDGPNSLQNDSFYFSGDGKICITTTGFSAYVCVRCKHSNSFPQPEVFVVGCGTNNHQADGLSTGFVSVAVGDRRLTIKDFQPTNAVSKPRKLTLPETSSLGKPHLGFKLRFGVSNSKWQHICFNSGESAPDWKFLSLREILHCAGPDCQGDPDESTAWQLETTQPSDTAALLRCSIVITYLPQGDNMGDCSTNLRDFVMDITPRSETSTIQSNPTIPIVQVIKQVEQMVVHGGEVQTAAPSTVEHPRDLGSLPSQLPLPIADSTEEKKYRSQDRLIINCQPCKSGAKSYALFK